MQNASRELLVAALKNMLTTSTVFANFVILATFEQLDFSSRCFTASSSALQIFPIGPHVLFFSSALLYSASVSAALILARTHHRYDGNVTYCDATDFVRITIQQSLYNFAHELRLNLN